MGCPFEQEVALLADSELEFARRVVVEAHLAVCESCAQLEAAADLVERVLASGAEEPLGVIDAAISRIPEPRRVPVLAVSSVAAAILVAVFVWPSASPPVLPVTPETPLAELPPPARPKGPPLHEMEVSEAAQRVVREGAAGSAALARMLRSRDPEMVARALAVAERAPSPWLAQSLVALLEDEDVAPRAARLLGSVGDVGAVPALEAALRGTAAVEAREALVAMGAADALARHLGEEGMLDAVVRADPRRGARALAACGQRKRETAKLVLRRHGKRVLPELRRLAGRGGAGAIRVLGWARDAGSLALLASLARKPSLALPATRALLELGSDAALEAAFRVIVRGAPRESFDGATRAEPFLIRACEEGSFSERRIALELLARCGGTATVEMLGRTRLPRSLFRSAIETLAGIHHESSARLLVDLLTRRRSEREAGRALASMPAAVAVPVLLQNFESRQIRRVLVSIAGVDLGQELESWKRWWDSHP